MYVTITICTYVNTLLTNAMKPPVHIAKKKSKKKRNDGGSKDEDNLHM